MTTTVQQREFMGHPLGLYICFFTEMWERFAFYGMKALLFLYLTQHHLFTDHNGYLLLGTYAGLAYALPVVGGLLADKYLGMRKAVLLGGILLVIGQFGMAYKGAAATADSQDGFALQMMYLSLAFIIVGVGFLKPNISTIVGRLYGDTDPRRDSAFTIFYMGINIGAFVSSLFVGYVGIKYGWEYGFASAGVGMMLGLIVFVLGQKHFHGHAEPANPSLLKVKLFGAFNRETSIYLGSLIGVIAVQVILQMKFSFLAAHEITATEAVAVLMTIVLMVWWTKFILSQCNAKERAQMIVLMVLIAISAVFWGLYEQTYGTWLAFSDRVMNTAGLGVQWNASQLTSVGAFFIFILSPIFAWLWPVLDKRGWNPSSSVKFGWGLVFAGLAHFVLVFAAQNPEANGLAGFWYFILAYFVLEVGEMVLSPIGLSAVTTLSVPRVVSLMMGVWFLASAFGEMLAGRFGTLAAMDPSTTVPQALAVYSEVFNFLGWFGVACGVFMFAITPWMKKAMKNATTAV